MKKFILGISFALSVPMATTARADIAGGDVVVLTQILSNAIQQLTQLYNIVRTARDNLSLIRDINRGINDSLHLMQVVSGNQNVGMYGDFQNANQVIQHLKNTYGQAVSSNLSTIHSNLDQLSGEAIIQNKRAYDFARKIDQVGNSIDRQSHAVSPGGAAKLTAQGVGMMLQAMDESIRTQGTALKLQAEALALQNFKDKEQTKHALESSNILKKNMQEASISPALPRF